MFDYQLFLAFEQTSSYQQELAQVSDAMRAFFIQNGHSDYLQILHYEGKDYLAKPLGLSIELSSLESMQAHLYSLLKKLVPHYPYAKDSLILLALPYSA